MQKALSFSIIAKMHIHNLTISGKVKATELSWKDHYFPFYFKSFTKLTQSPNYDRYTCRQSSDYCIYKKIAYFII